MELSAFVIYLIGSLENIRSSFGFFLFVLSCIVFGSGLFLIMSHTQSSLFVKTKEEDRIHKVKIKWLKRVLVISSILWVLFGLVCTFLPSSKTVIAMITVPAIVNNEEVQKLPSNIVQFVNGYLEENIRKYQRNE